MVLAAVEGIVSELRRIGVPVSTGELVDAAESLTVVDIGDREAVRNAVGACVASSAEHMDAFETVFDLYLPEHPAPGGPSTRALTALDDADLRTVLLRSLAADGRTAQREVARIAVDRHSGIRPGHAVAGTFAVFRTLRALGGDTLAEELTALLPATQGPTAALDIRLARERAERAAAAFGAMVRSQVRRRLVADRGADAVAETVRTPLPEDEDFLTASTDAIERMRPVVEPMGRLLGRSLTSTRRRRGRGPLDFRATIRGSLSTGGVPVRPQYRRPRPPKPKLVVIADISGSVATFASFTLQLTAALQAQFSSLRSFVFIDGMDEVTDLLTEYPTLRDATARMNEERRGLWFDGRSDYGRALELFHEHHLGAVDRRTTVLLLGDARANYHDPRTDLLADLRTRAGRLYWLNPERRAMWDDGDSCAGAYATHCDGFFECRSIRGLRAFVESLA